MKVTKKLLIIVFKQANGVVSMAVNILKKNHGIEITRHSLDERIRKNPDVKEALDSACNEVRDMAEHVLIKKIKNEDFKAVKYILDRAERRDELTNKRTGGKIEDEVFTFGVKPPPWEVEGITNEEWCANLKKKKEKNNDNPNS